MHVYIHVYIHRSPTWSIPESLFPPREAKLFRNNKSQAVRIPADFELPGDRVMIHRDGDRLIIEPVHRKNLLEVLASLEPLGPEDQFPDADDTLLPVKEIDL
ncbi:antitoxin [Rhizobium leguminosarum]|uniref:antitoxin n=1 Tax=Rhizobium leguminosarum TaxID=384 RepID=UPI003CC91D75